MSADDRSSFALLTACSNRRRFGCVSAQFQIGKNEPDQLFVDVVAAEMRIAARGEHFEDSFAQLENGNVERAAAEVVNRDGALLAFLQAVRERCRSRFVDDAQDVESGNAAGIFRGLTLRIVEVGGDRDDGVDDLFAQCRFGIRFSSRRMNAEICGRRVFAAEDLQANDVFAVGRNIEGKQRQDRRGHRRCLCP